MPPTPSQIGSSACSGRGEIGRVGERRAETALPGHPLGSVEHQEQVELFGEERVVVGEVVAEERERFDEGAAPGDQLGAPAGDEVDRREILEDADRIEGREDRHRAGQADPAGDRGDRGHDDRRRGNGDVEPVMLAEAENGEADVLREFRRGKHLAIALGDRDRAARSANPG